MNEPTVEFGASKMPIVGVFAGILIALGLPFIVLKWGQTLGPTALMWIVILSLVMGGVIALVAAFFGIVIPRTVREPSSRKENSPES